jgi:hypothetical protein
MLQRGGAHELADERQSLGELGHQVGVRGTQLLAHGAPDDALQRVHGTRDRRRRRRAGQLTHPGRQRLQNTAGRQPAQIRVVGDGAQHRVADAGAVPGQLGGQDPRRLVERRLLDQGQQPPPGQIL